MAPIRTLALLMAAALLLGWGPATRAQDAPKDDTLDQLLKKLEDTQKEKDREKEAEAAKAKGDPKAADTKKAKEAAKPGEVRKKDQALDSLLEKLGETRDTPEAGGRPAAPGQLPAPPPDQAGKASKDSLKDKDKEFDEHLEELLGRKRKKKNQDEDQDSGPMASLIKKMRDVEQRLGKPDTGEDTRKEQEQIVKEIDQLIEQLKKSGGQGGRTMRMVQQPGQRQGNQQGGPGAQNPNGNGVGPMKPAKPPVKSVLANDKNPWGHLPPELRGVMDNVFKEEALPEKADLISRYYLSVNKKAKSREE